MFLESWKSHWKTIFERIAIISDHKFLKYEQLGSTPFPDIPWLEKFSKGETWIAPPRSGVIPESLTKHISNFSNVFVLQSTGSTTSPKWLFYNGSDFTINYPLKIKKNQKVLACYEPYHIGFIDIAFNCFSSGNTLIVPLSSKLVDIQTAIEKHEPDVICLSPLMLWFLDKSEAQLFQRTQKIILGGVQPHQGFIQDFTSRYKNIQLLETFGSSETGVIATYESGSHIPSDKIVNQNGKFFLKPHPGLIGIWENDVYTPIEKNVLITASDYFIPSEKGWKWAGRDSDFVSIGGEKVSLSELNSFVSHINGVLFCKAIASPHPTFNQLIKLICIKKEGYDEAELIATIRNEVSQKLGPNKVPHFFEFISEMRLNDRGKPVWS